MFFVCKIAILFVIINKMLFNVLNQNLTAEQAVIIFLITIFVFFISLTLHEFAHGFVAYKMGDPTPKLSGRLTLNPFKHVSGMGVICFMLIGVGWAKPMPINPINFKRYKKGIRLTSIAGILSNFLLGLLATIIYTILSATVGFTTTFMIYVEYLLDSFMWINSFLALFNLIPLFPLDGFNFVTSFMKADNKFISWNIKNGYKVLLGLLLVCLFTDLIFEFDLLDFYLSLLYNYVYTPITWLGAL